jgi:hypothetical protein
MEYGDYQTPPDLARECCQLLKNLGVDPASIIEPTCGVGSFLEAALDTFPNAVHATGIEINSEYAAEAARRLPQKARVEVADIFTLDWQSVMSQLPDPLLVAGNPPWVTNSALGQIASHNVPLKKRSRNQNGIEAITGKSNFDISEWMLLRLLDQMNGRTGVIAMLCKTAVARKVLQYAWANRVQISDARLYGIDAARHFSAAVEACFMVCTLSPGGANRECSISLSLEGDPDHLIGYRNGEIVADVKSYDRHIHLRGETAYKWRSGIKHDCSKVMEFERHAGEFRNGLNEIVDIEDTCVFPLFKGSDVANGRTSTPVRYMLVPQKRVGDETALLQQTAPKTWAYLQSHRRLLDARGSIIYSGRPPFSIFGIGDYAFAPWKVAIPGLYKTLTFHVIGPFDGKPPMLDDTAYFLPCRSRAEAESLAQMLNSPLAASFFRAIVFWDSKRPITASLLSQLSIERLAAELVDCST